MGKSLINTMEARTSVIAFTAALAFLFISCIHFSVSWAGSESDINSASKNASGANAEVKTDTDANPNAAQITAIMDIEADAEFGAYLGGECLSCHSPRQEVGAIPQIHGKDKGYLINALLEYKNKQRENEVMRGVAVALSNEEIAALATYLSEQ